MWEDKANLYNKLEDNIKAFKSLRASFFFKKKGGGNITALATIMLIGFI
jgi:hypothetical protein